MCATKNRALGAVAKILSQPSSSELFVPSDRSLKQGWLNISRHIPCPVLKILNVWQRIRI